MKWNNQTSISRYTHKLVFYRRGVSNHLWVSINCTLLKNAPLDSLNHLVNDLHQITQFMSNILECHFFLEWFLVHVLDLPNLKSMPVCISIWSFYRNCSTFRVQHHLTCCWLLSIHSSSFSWYKSCRNTSIIMIIEASAVKMKYCDEIGLYK